MEGQAGDLGGSWLAANDLTFTERHLAAVKRVTPADVQRVAYEYLTPENRTLYALLPDGAAPKTCANIEINSDQPVQKFELPNGLRLLVKENHRLPFVEFRAAFKGGVLAETAEDNGITQLLAKTLIKGTKRRSAKEIAREIESVGGSLDSYGGNNSFGVNAEVLSDDFVTGLELVADVLLHPIFPADALEREREVQIANIQSQKDDLLKSASVAMRRALFGDTGYGLDSLAAKALMSRRTFTRRFRKLTGTTVGQWLLGQRLTLAQRLLETSDQPIERIAVRAGFGSALSMRQHFSAALKTSPSTYRREFRGGPSISSEPA